MLYHIKDIGSVPLKSGYTQQLDTIILSNVLEAGPVSQFQRDE